MAYICASCGTYDKTKRITPGSFWIEVGLWMLLLVPGILYSFWRLGSRYTGCAECKSRDIVKESSPRGQELKEKYIAKEA